MTNLLAVQLLDIHFSVEGIVAVCATFIALLSLAVSYWQLKIQRTFNRNMLKPLPWFFINLGDSEFFVDFYNAGLGPLIIVSTLFEREKKSKRHLESLLKNVPGHAYKLLSPGKVIAAGETVRIWEKKFDADDPDTDEGVERLKEIFYLIRATIRYKDVYDFEYPAFQRSFDFMKDAIDQ